MPKMQVNGTGLWVEEVGDGVPVIFSHSLFFDHTMFAHQAAAFAPTHRVIRYDHRGQGQSDPSATVDMDTLAEDAAALIETLGAGPCHFVGNSLGGFVALRLAINRADLLRSVTILGSSAEAEHRVAEFAPLVPTIRTEGIAPHIDTIMYIMFGDTFLANPARTEDRGYWRAKIAALPNALAESVHAVVFRTEVLAALAGCQIPLLAISGTEDHAYGPAEAENAARAAGGRHVKVEQAGHSLAVEQPDAINALLRGHFVATEQRKAA